MIRFDDVTLSSSQKINGEKLSISRLFTLDIEFEFIDQTDCIESIEEILDTTVELVIDTISVVGLSLTLLLAS